MVRAVRQGESLRTVARQFHVSLSTVHYWTERAEGKRLSRVDWQNRAHFFAIASQLMRHILVDHARSHAYAKRGGGTQTISLDEAMVVSQERAAEVVALDDVLKQLAEIDPQQSRIVELRFFGGLTIEETAVVLSLSPATIKREWTSAKAWLYHELAKG